MIEDQKTAAKINLNFVRNKKQDQTEQIDQAASVFSYADCRDQ